MFLAQRIHLSCDIITVRAVSNDIAKISQWVGGSNLFDNTLLNKFAVGKVDGMKSQLNSLHAFKSAQKIMD